MNRSEVLEKISEIIRTELSLGEGMNMEENTTFLEIGLDSVGLMSLLVYVEETFGFEAGEDAILGDNLENMGNMVDYVLKNNP